MVFQPKSGRQKHVRSKRLLICHCQHCHNENNDKHWSKGPRLALVVLSPGLIQSGPQKGHISQPEGESAYSGSTSYTLSLQTIGWEDAAWHPSPLEAHCSCCLHLRLSERTVSGDWAWSHWVANLIFGGRRRMQTDDPRPGTELPWLGLWPPEERNMDHPDWRNIFTIPHWIWGNVSLHRFNLQALGLSLNPG